MQHQLHDASAHAGQEWYTCFICEGGLADCTTCGGAEGAMPTDCPGAQMTSEQIDAVYAGTLDYRGGQWVELTSPHSPAAIREEVTPIHNA